MDNIENLTYILFICVTAPLLLMLLLLKGKSRLLLGYMLIGIFISLSISELDNILLLNLGDNLLYVSTTVTPITEEIVKALPILFYAYLFSDEKDILLPISFATGIGFALFENMTLLTMDVSGASLSWAVVRGFSTALMHGLCTAAIGFGISFVKKRRKLFFCGTFALLTLAIIYHGIFNMLVQSEYKYLGLALPVVTYIPLLIQRYEVYKKLKKTKKKV